ncbi:nitroreductase family protein, partial [Faecalibaculum rodentium]
MNSIFHRRSIRQFTPEVPDNGQIEQILKAAMAA